MTRWLSLLLLVVSLSTAQAQPGATMATPARKDPATPHKDPSTAMAISIATTLAGTAVVLASKGNEAVVIGGLAGMYVGPSTGQWYAGRVGTIGLAARAGAAVLVYKGFQLLDQQGYDCLGYTDAECRAAEERWDREAKRGGVMFYSGLALWAGSTVFDVVMARHAANAWNREHDLVVAPTVLPAAGGRAPGVSVSLTF